MATTELTPAQKIRATAKAATRRALLEAGLAESMDRGGIVPSIESICARAGYTRGAFYVHFKSREQFIVELLDWVVGDIFEQLFWSAGREDADLDVIITRFTTTLVKRDWPDGVDIRSAYLGVMASVRELAPVRDRHAKLMGLAIGRLEQAIREGQDAGRLNPAIEAGRAAELVMLVGIGLIVWDGVGIPVDPAALGRAFLDLLDSTPAKKDSTASGRNR